MPASFTMERRETDPVEGKMPPCLPVVPAALENDDADLPPTCQAIAPAHSPIPGTSGSKEKYPVVSEQDFPEVGAAFLGFDLLAQVGQGAFGKVYLARQRELGERQVVLKITTEAAGEINVLAQLLHGNIVPVYSVHQDGFLHAVCMPFLGTTTLADVLRQLRTHGLPDSGKYLVQTLQEHRSARFSSRSHPSSGPKPSSTPSSAPSAHTPPPANLPETKPGTLAILEKLQGFSYVEAVLWMGSQLADGLAHAHDHGIVHRDLKPANILLTDDGVPLLLDFNLAEDTKQNAPEKARLGGTLPYMAPEQLRALAGEKPTLDAKTDLYSLGVILFELLTGHFPFPTYKGPTRDYLGKMLDDRQQAPPRLRKWNRAITPAVEAIVRHCLEPNPARRYQSARELQEDLQRHQNNLPLCYAGEPSWRERAGKWARRHPRLTSLTSVSTLALAALVALALVLASASQRLRRFEAEENFQRFENELAAVNFLVTSPAADQKEMDEFFQLGDKALARFHAREPDWRSRPEVGNLPVEFQEKLRGGVLGLFIMMAQAKAIEAAGLPPGPERDAKVRQALDFNDQAHDDGADQHLPHALWSQRAVLLALLDKKDEADKCQAQAARVEPKNGKDAYLAGRDLAGLGRYREAIPLLEDATRQEPQNVPAWFLLGRCHDSLSQDKDALACYTICLALGPKAFPAHFYRGLVYLRLRDYPQAKTDFTRAIELEPKNPDAYFNRSLALNGLARNKEAIDDLTRGLELKAPYTRLYFLRSRYKELAGDKNGAKRDKDEGMKRVPGDDLSWTTRGFNRLPGDPRGALADFKKALEINPRSLPALVNAAHVLGRIQGKNDEALPYLNRSVELYPDYLPARTSRGLLLARMGKRQEALRDAGEVSKRNPGPPLLFQLAGIYAQTSRREPADEKQALQNLTLSLRQGHGFDLIETDPDLAPLRTNPQFRRLVEAVRALR